MALQTQEPIAAYVNFIIDDCLLIRQVKVIRLHGFHFLSLPAKKLKTGDHLETVAPINPETRRLIDDAVLTEFERVTGEQVIRRVRSSA